MSEAAIPPPTTEDLARDLADDYDLFRTDRPFSLFQIHAGAALVRRCHAAEARVKELERYDSEQQGLCDRCGAVIRPPTS